MVIQLGRLITPRMSSRNANFQAKDQIAMPYSKFTHDIFLSYRHLDNQPLSGEKEGWITRLHRDLETRVAQLAGTAVSMWRDGRLQGNDYFSDVIEEQLHNVAVMVSVMSPGYKISDWCNRELRGFLTATEKRGGIRFGTKSRLFKVLKTPTGRQDQPEALQDLLGYEFFHEGREFHLDPDPSAEKRYLAKLDDLARDIQSLLREMATGNASSVPGSAPSDQRKAVYLAWTTSDLQDSRDSIRRELLDRDLVVLPETDPPMRADSLADSVRRALGQCQLSIHPIGSRFGVVPEGDSRSLAWLQHDLATERYKLGAFRRILWMPPDLVVQEETQKDFLGRLEREIGGSANGFQFLKTSLEELKTIVIKQLDEEVPTATPKAAGSSGRIHVYLICERTDHDAVQPLATFLRQRGYVVDLPLLTGDPSDIRTDHQETLAACDAVLLYHGAGSEAWLREKIRDCRKVFGWGREKPFLANGIYLGPEPDQLKREYQNDEFVICRSYERVSPEALEPFVAAVSQPGERR